LADEPVPSFSIGEDMPSVGNSLFLLLPESAQKRVLHPGKVVELQSAAIVCEFQRKLDLPPGTEILVFFSGTNGRFMQQGALVIAPETSPETSAAPAIEKQPAAAEQPATAPAPCNPTVTFELVGEAVSAEKRQTYRVSIPLANIKGQVGSEADCHVVDVSPLGCAVVTRREYKIGSTVQVQFACEGHSVAAEMRVQTMKPTPEGRFRYGFFVAEKTSPARKTLMAMSMSIQRQQLKRMSGAA
jgi:hypothetical protein